MCAPATTAEALLGMRPRDYSSRQLYSHTATALAVRYGLITVPNTCVACGRSDIPRVKQAPIVLHHWSLAARHALSVIPCCWACHHRIHRGIIPEPYTGRVYSTREDWTYRYELPPGVVVPSLLDPAAMKLELRPPGPSPRPSRAKGPKRIDWTSPTYAAYATRRALKGCLPCDICGRNIAPGERWARGRVGGEKGAHAACRDGLIDEARMVRAADDSTRAAFVAARAASPG
jgi:hypothetical protein